MAGISATGALCLVFIVVALSVSWWRRRRIVSLVERIPGPYSLPFIGNALELNLEHDLLFIRLNGITQLFGRHSGICRAWLGTRPYILVTSPDFLEKIMASSKHIDKSSEYHYLHPWLNTGLLTSGGRKWQTRRKILTPAFHFRILDDFMAVFREQSDTLVERLREEVGGTGFNIFPYVTLCALDIICETAMGRKVFAQLNSESEYVRSVYEMGHIVLQRQARLWLQWDSLFRFSSLYKRQQRCIQVLHGFSSKMVKERRSQLQDAAVSGITQEEDSFGRKKRLAFLDLLIDVSQDGRVLSDDDIREEVDTFMFEGHDTTSAAICWCLFLIGCDPDVQNKVHEELDSIFYDDPEREVTMTDLANMKYLECCIKEALRLYPSVPNFGRLLTQDVQLGKYLVPAGTTALILLYTLHRNSQSFPAPEKFDPSRFSCTSSPPRHPYSYIPFSAGPRNCIGQKFAILEEKTVLSSIFRKYRVESLDRREDLTLLGELILRPKHGLHVRLHRR